MITLPTLGGPGFGCTSPQRWSFNLSSGLRNANGGGCPFRGSKRLCMTSFLYFSANRLQLFSVKNAKEPIYCTQQSEDVLCYFKSKFPIRVANIRTEEKQSATLLN